MTLYNLKETLLTVSEKTYHYRAPQNTQAPYIVYAEDGQGESKWADNKMTYQAIEGTIDLYTPTENDERIDKIQNALNSAEISFYLNSVQYEDETNLIHYEWVWEIGNHQI